MPRKKAQVFTFDVFMSLIFFVSVFVIWLIITNQLVEQASYAYEINMLDKKLQRASDLLIRSKGVPENWDSDSSNVKAFGLVKDTEYIVSREKLLEFLNIGKNDIDRIKSNLGFGGYNLYIRFANITGGDFDPANPYEIGSFPSNPKIVVSIKRYFLIDFNGNEELAVMQMIAWR